MKKIVLFLLLLLIGCAHAPLDRTDESETTIETPPVPSSGRAYYYYMLGINAKIKWNLDEALSYYQKAVEADPESPVLKTEMADVLVKLGKIDEALLFAEESYRKDPDNLTTLFVLGDIYTKK
ncbi:MAG: tetratricopeptide repeat protein, partial [bacterium]